MHCEEDLIRHPARLQRELIHPSVHLGQQRGDPLQQEASDDFSQKRPDAWRMDEQTSIEFSVLSDTRSVNDERETKRRKAETLECEPCSMRQNSFRGQVLFAVKCFPDELVLIDQ